MGPHSIFSDNFPGGQRRGAIASLIWISDHTIVLSMVAWDIDAEHTDESLVFRHWVYHSFPHEQCHSFGRRSFLFGFCACIFVYMGSSFIAKVIILKATTLEL